MCQAKACTPTALSGVRLTRLSEGNEGLLSSLDGYKRGLASLTQKEDHSDASPPVVKWRP